MQESERLAGTGPELLYGCLTGDGRSAPVCGSYRFCRRGLTTPFPPDLAPDADDSHIDFAAGKLTGGRRSVVGWKGASLGQVGVDIVIDLGHTYFVDRVVLHQGDASHVEAGPRHDSLLADPSTPATARARTVPPAGLSHAAVYAGGGEGAPQRLAAIAGTPNQPAPLVDAAVTLVVAMPARELTLRLSSDNRDILLAGIEVWGANPGEPALYPLPMQLARLGGEPLQVAALQAVLVPAAASPETLRAAEVLVESLAMRTGRSLPVHAGADAPSPHITIGTPDELGPVAADLPRPRPEGYALRIDCAGAVAVASDLRGLLYAAEAMVQALTAGGGAPCQVVDEPYKPLRGVHLYLPHRRDIDFYKRLIRHVLLPMRYNTIFIELAGAMRFDRHPEIAEAWERTNRLAAEGKVPPIAHSENGGGSYLTKAEVADIVRYAEGLGFEVIPEVQSLSHVEYLTQVYPEIAEDQSTTYPDSYCPHHPLSHQLVFDMIDEAVEVFQPKRYVHMGHDEVYTMAVDERCRGHSRAALFAYDVQRLYDYLRSKGLGMVIWADMLQDFQPYGAPEAIDAIPKDILLLDFVWYFRTGEDIEDRLLAHGYSVGMGNLYSSHYPRFSERIAKPGMVGGEVSTWTYASEAGLGRIGKLYDFAYTANMLWSPHYREELRAVFDRRVANLLADMGDRLADGPGPSRLPGAAFAPLSLPAAQLLPRRDVSSSLGGYDLENLPTGPVTLGGVPFSLADGLIAVQSEGTRSPAARASATIEVSGRADSIVLLLATSSNAPFDGRLGQRVATCRLRYSDGSQEDTDLLYGWQLAEWDRRHGEPVRHGAYRHFGYVGTYPSRPLWQDKTASGSDVTLYGFELLNPHPGREVSALDLLAGNTDAALLVAGITAVRLP